MVVPKQPLDEKTVKQRALARRGERKTACAVLSRGYLTFRGTPERMVDVLSASAAGWAG